MKTSDLYRRARQLADLEGSDFITWNEAINCINEAYVGLYEKLINIGDNSFMKSYHMKDKVEKLPKDFWQLKGVYLWNNGNLKTINRRAGNTSIHFISYEIRNDEICISGNADDVYIEYYTKPKTLLMSPSDKEVTLNLPEGAVILGCCEHTFLYKTQNESSQDIICVYDLDGIKNAFDIFETFSESKMWINKDFVFTLVDDDLIVYDLATGNSFTYADSVPLINESGELFVIQGGYICSLVFNGDSYATRQIKEFSLTDSGFYYVCDDDFNDIYGLVETADGIIIYHNGEVTDQNAKAIIYAKENCYYVAINKAGYFDSEGNNNLIKAGIGSPIGFISINENTGYGYATEKYNKVWVCAYCEDTELDFPNTFFYKALSYMLAIAFRCKQGADISLLSTQLEMAMQTFTDTLGSDDYQFARMGNVYN
jgi:hypothetical protein